MIDTAKYTVGTVVSRVDHTPDLWSIRIRPEEEITFRAGQYVTVGIEHEGDVVERPYSIVSSPDEPDLELFIELVPDGALTPLLHPVGEGARLLMRRRCKGVFLRECPLADQAHVFAATVTGVAPFVSWLRQQAARARAGEWTPGGPIVLIQGASRSVELSYARELEALQDDIPGLAYVPTVSRPWEDTGWSGERGRAEDVLRKHADGAGAVSGRAGIFLCGHPGMIIAARRIFNRAGFPDSDIREEQYWPEGKEPTGGPSASAV